MGKVRRKKKAYKVGQGMDLHFLYVLQLFLKALHPGHHKATHLPSKEMRTKKKKKREMRTFLINQPCNICVYV